MSKLGDRLNRQLHATSPLMTRLSQAADYMLLGLFAVLLCIPVVTAGASVTAMFYVAFRYQQGREGKMIPLFFSSFKQNFKQSTLLWLITVLAAAVIAVDLYFYLCLAATVELFGILFFAAFLVTSFIVIMETMYCFPYVAKFKCTNRQAIRSSAYLGLKHLPTTLLLIVADAGLTVGCMFVPFLFLFLPGVLLWIHSFFIHRIFMKYIPKTPEVPAADTPEPETGEEITETADTGDTAPEEENIPEENRDVL